MSTEASPVAHATKHQRGCPAPPKKAEQMRRNKMQQIMPVESFRGLPENPEIGHLIRVSRNERRYKHAIEKRGCTFIETWIGGCRGVNWLILQYKGMSASEAGPAAQALPQACVLMQRCNKVF